MEPARQDFRGDPPPYTSQPQAAACSNARIAQSAYVIGAVSPHTQYPYPQGIPASAYQEYPAGYMVSAGNGHQTQTTIVMTQPGGFVSEEDSNSPPESYMALSICACLCCCWPLGLLAIIKSCQVNDAVNNGDLAAANEASKKARGLASCSIIIGVCFTVAFIAIQVTLSRRY